MTLQPHTSNRKLIHRSVIKRSLLFNKKIIPGTLDNANKGLRKNHSPLLRYLNIE